MPLNEPPMKIFCVRHWIHVSASTNIEIDFIFRALAFPFDEWNKFVEVLPGL